MRRQVRILIGSGIQFVLVIMVRTDEASCGLRATNFEALPGTATRSPEGTMPTTLNPAPTQSALTNRGS